MTTDPTITIAGLRATIEREYYREQACTMAGEIVELQAERRGHAAERQSLTAERDALAAQLAEVRTKLDATPKVCAIHSYEHGPGPCMTCGAWPPGTRELIAACQTRIAGLEQAAGERAKEVARLTAELAAERQERAAGVTAAITDVREIERLNREIDELRSPRAAYFGAAVGVAQALGLSSLGPAGEDPRFYAEALAFARSLEGHAKKLTARMAELETRPVLTEDLLRGALDAHGYAGLTRKLFAHLGPVTLPSQDRAEELVSAWRGICTDTATCDLDPAERMRRALASLGTPPTSPPAARPVFAGVSGTGQVSEPERSEWIGAAVAVADALGGSLGPVSGTSGTIDPREWIHFAAGLADRAKKLTARMAELEARPVLTVEAFTEAYIKTKHGGKAWPGEEAGRRGLTAQFRATFAALGPVALPSPDRAEELFKAYLDAPGSDAEAMRHALASLGTPPTSPPAARPVFAGVSEEELALEYARAVDRIPGIRAVLARLEVSLVTPVDPEVVARRYHDHKESPVPEWPYAADHDINSPIGADHEQARLRATAAMRATLTAAGVPVTPERGQ